MSIKNIIFSTLFVFIFIFIEQFIAHGFVLKGFYALTPDLWRSEADYLIGHMTIIQVLFSLILSVIFSANYENKGYSEGVRFGLLIGTLLAILEVGKYAYMPIPIGLALAWAADFILLCIGAGLILSFCSKKLS